MPEYNKGRRQQIVDDKLPIGEVAMSLDRDIPRTIRFFKLNGYLVQCNLRHIDTSQFSDPSYIHSLSNEELDVIIQACHDLLAVAPQR